MPSTHPTKLGKICRLFRRHKLLPAVASEIAFCRSHSGRTDCASTFRDTRHSVRTAHRPIDWFFAKKYAKHPNKPTKPGKHCRTLPLPRTKGKVLDLTQTSGSRTGDLVQVTYFGDINTPSLLFAYDRQDRVQTASQTLGPSGSTTTFAYNQRTSQVIGDGSHWAYDYDALRQVQLFGR